jgi:hypothetical protein
MTSKRPGYVRLWLALLACGIIVPGGSLLDGAASASPSLPPGFAAPPQPAPMPAFNLPSLKGPTIRSADLQGKVVIVRFWATW